jgi:hypothetical protein
MRFDRYKGCMIDGLGMYSGIANLNMYIIHTSEVFLAM